MKNIAKALILSLSTAVALPAFAAPNNGQPEQHQPASSHQKDNRQAQNHQKKQIQPNRDWKAGQKVPSQYRGASYKVNPAHNKRLTKPGKNQQWIKVNGDYVLTNMVTHTIIKVIRG